MILSPEVASALEFKNSLEERFELAAGLDGRAYYSAVYSLPRRSPLLWINLNPGGTPENHKVLSDGDLAKGKHEFFEGHGKTSVATGKFLRGLFVGQEARVRSIQGTNVVWQRSEQGSDLDITQCARLTAPFVRETIKYVKPELLIFGGIDSCDKFIAAQNATILSAEEPVMGPWGKNKARIAQKLHITIPEIGEVHVVAVSHPSRGVRADAFNLAALATKGIALPAPLQMLV